MSLLSSFSMLSSPGRSAVSSFVERRLRSSVSWSLMPMVQRLTDGGVVLRWRLASAGLLVLRVVSGNGECAYESLVSPVSDWYEAEIDSLVGGEKYSYEIVTRWPENSRRCLFRGGFRASPGRGQRLRFLVFGDSGDGRSKQRNLAAMMPRWDADLVLHTGDLVFPRGAAEDYERKFFRPNADLIARSAFYPTLGNHDYDDNRGRPLLDTFALPNNGPVDCVPGENYWFDCGDVRFVCINSNEPFREMRDRIVPWLDGVLFGAQDRWKVVFFHHPIYTNGRYSPSGKLRELVSPLFDKYGVDLAFNGHNHMYERSHPICGGQVVRGGGGAVYVTSGAGGNPLYDANDVPSRYLACQDDSEHSFTVVDVDCGSTFVQQVGISGHVLDRFLLSRTVSGGAAAAGNCAGGTSRGGIKGISVTHGRAVQCR